MRTNKEKLYVIGFPKSGNTWLSRILSDVLDSNMRNDGVSDKINRATNSNEKRGKYLICKIHKISSKDTLENLKKSKKIYIMRDPRAVVTSGFFYNYSIFSEDQVKTNRILKMFFNYEANVLNKSWQNNFFFRVKTTVYQLIKKIFLEARKDFEVGDWSDHIKFWRNFENIYFLKYEDLSINTEEEIVRLFENFDLPVDRSLMKEAVERQSFDKMKKNFIQKKDPINVKFMRSGKINSWVGLLNKRTQKNIEKRHGSVMSEYGYEVVVDFGQKKD